MLVWHIHHSTPWVFLNLYIWTMLYGGIIMIQVSWNSFQMTNFTCNLNNCYIQHVITIIWLHVDCLQTITEFVDYKNPINSHFLYETLSIPETSAPFPRSTWGHCGTVDFLLVKIDIPPVQESSSLGALYGHARWPFLPLMALPHT